MPCWCSRSGSGCSDERRRPLVSCPPGQARLAPGEAALRIDDDLYALARALGSAALQRRLRLATAESCTGGLVAAAITAVAGSSDWFDRGFVTYSDAAKVKDLAVPAATLARYGAVSEQTALAMAQGALRGGEAQWSVAVTGIAGPGGGTPDKPVGTVCFAWVGPSLAQTLRVRLDGDRAGVRRESVRIALQGLLERLAPGPSATPKSEGPSPD
jgi:nicotinamide-nucleotide amidase